MEPLAIYEQNSALILASEDWAKVYKKDADSFGQLIKAEAKLSRVLLEYLKELSERAHTWVDWNGYNRRLSEITAADSFDVSVLVFEVPDNENGLVMSIAYQPIAEAVAAGVSGAEATYKIILPDTGLPETIDVIARKQVAGLVGKRVDKNGNILDAKNPAYHVNEVTRQQIRDSIGTSLALGENQQDATARLTNRIKDAKRAAKIASTEAVNAYQGGQFAYAKATGAIGKEWQSLLGACSKCEGNSSVGVIAIDATFPSGVQAPSTHPWDRCGMRFVYKEEIDGGAVDLATIAQIDTAGRPSADINTDIENLLRKGDAGSVTKSIALAKQLPPDDVLAMLNSISYNGKSVIDGYYTIHYDVATKKVIKELLPGKKDPLTMTAEDIARAAGIDI